MNCPNCGSEKINKTCYSFSGPVPGEFWCQDCRQIFFIDSNKLENMQLPSLLKM